MTPHIIIILLLTVILILLMLSFYFLTKEPPKYKPMIADTKLVSNGVITKLFEDSVTHFIISFSGIKKNPGLNSKYPTITLVSGDSTGISFGNNTIANTASNAIILLVH